MILVARTVVHTAVHLTCTPTYCEDADMHLVVGAVVDCWLVEEWGHQLYGASERLIEASGA